MTRVLRQRHRTAVLILASALPAGVALALAARPVLPPVTPVQPFDAPVDTRPLRVAWQTEHHDERLRVSVRMGWADDRSRGEDASGRSTMNDVENGAGSRKGGPLLDLDVVSRTAEPQLLAYWTPRAATALGSGPDADAVLLGSVAFDGTRRFALPGAARTSSGGLLLYGLAQGRIAAHVALPAAEGLAGDQAGPR